MAMVFKSADDASDHTELVGVGTLFPGARGGIPVERAAEVMSELQEKNADGSLRLDENGNPIPLSGSKLTAAAKAFAELRGIQVANLNEDKIAALPAEVGQPPDRPPAAEAAKADFRAMYGEGDLPVFNNNADHNVQGQPPYTTSEDPAIPPLPAGASGAQVVKGGEDE
jgi:hypothetical protein